MCGGGLYVVMVCIYMVHSAVSECSTILQFAFFYPHPELSELTVQLKREMMLKIIHKMGAKKK